MHSNHLLSRSYGYIIPYLRTKTMFSFVFLCLDYLTLFSLESCYGCTEKTIFLQLLTKMRLRYCYAGAHTGAPLRLYLRRFRIFLGADRCVRPQVRLYLNLRLWLQN